MKKGKIGLIGVGFLGKPLAKKLTAEGYDVVGTTKREYDLLNDDKIPAQLKLCDIVVYDVPPLENTEAVEKCFKQFSADQKFIYISSTSIFGPNAGQIDESYSPPENSPYSPIVLKLEMIAKQYFTNLCLLRFGGLYGNTEDKKRHPVHFLAGKTHLKTGAENLHLVHVEDCIEAIMTVIEENLFPEECNLVSDLRIPKKEYYTEMAKKFGLELPSYDDVETKNPTNISNEKSKEVLGMNYRNPLDYNLN
jgi:nucleoside-diphosphate-sugar epimerase